MKKWLALLFVMGMVGRAEAAFHLMKIVEVFPGTASQPNAQYVVLQMYSSGQTQADGKAITFFDASDNLVGTFAFSANLTNGANQTKILVATSEAQALFGVTADLTIIAKIDPAGGK